MVETIESLLEALANANANEEPHRNSKASRRISRKLRRLGHWRWGVLHDFSRAAFQTPSSERFECGDDNVFGHQIRRLNIREEQACSHRIQYADRLLGFYGQLFCWYDL